MKKNFGYLMKEGIRGIFLHGFMSFAAVCVTVACLIIVGSFWSLIYNLNIKVEDLNKTNEVLAFVDATLSDAEARSIGTQINKIPNVYESRFVTREEALTRFVEAHQNDSAFSGVDSTVLRHRYSITLEDNSKIEETVAAIEGINGVMKVNATLELANGFSVAQKVLHIVSIAIIIVLLIVSLLIISNTVKLAMYDRKEEIAIMKMVGATNGFIRLPFIVEGFLLGMVGAALAFFLEWALYNALITRIALISSASRLFSFVPFTELLGSMIAVFIGAGLFVGIVGSWTSIRKFMDV